MAPRASAAAMDVINLTPKTRWNKGILTPDIKNRCASTNGHKRKIGSKPDGCDKKLKACSADEVQFRIKKTAISSRVRICGGYSERGIPRRDCLGEADEFGISGQPIRADAVGLEPVLHIGLPGLIECHASLLHDFENLGLALIVKARPTIARLDIASEVKGAAGQSSVDVFGEAGGQPRIQIICARDVDVGYEVSPIVTREEESGGGNEEEKSDGEEHETHGERKE